MNNSYKHLNKLSTFLYTAVDNLLEKKGKKAKKNTKSQK